jgi:hypothetical protein
MLRRCHCPNEASRNALYHLLLVGCLPGTYPSADPLLLGRLFCEPLCLKDGLHSRKKIENNILGQQLRLFAFRGAESSLVD